MFMHSDKKSTNPVNAGREQADPHRPESHKKITPEPLHFKKSCTVGYLQNYGGADANDYRYYYCFYHDLVQYTLPIRLSQIYYCLNEHRLVIAVLLR